MKSTLVTWSRAELRFERSDGANHIEEAVGVGPKVVAAHIDDILQLKGWTADRLIYGIDSTRIFFVEADVDRSVAEDHEALCYELESRLPFDAESMAVVSVGENGTTSSFLAWETDGVRELIEALIEEYDLTFSAFMPAELAVAQRHRNGGKNISNLAIVNQKRMERFGWDGRRLTAWSFHPVGSGEDGFENADIVDANLRKELLAGLLNENNRTLQNLDHEFSEVVPFGDRKPGSIWEPVLLGMLVLLLGLFGGLLVRSTNADKDTKRIDAQVVNQYRTQFPNRRVRGKVDRLLQEELNRKTKLAGISAYPETSRNLLEQMSQLLSAFDSNIRLRIDEIVFGENDAQVAGVIKVASELPKLREGFARGRFRIVDSTFEEGRFSFRLAPGRQDDGGGQ